MLLTSLIEWKRRFTSPRFASRPFRRRNRAQSNFVAEVLEYRALLSSIYGTVFEDANANQTRDAGEGGLENATVYLDANNNSMLDDGEQSTTSDSSGNYVFQNLTAGDYVVRQVVPDGYRQTAPPSSQRLFATSLAGPASVVELSPQGAILNRFALPNTSPSTTEGLAFDGNTLYFYEQGQKILYELNPDNGTVLDSTDLSSQFANRNIGGLAAEGGKIYMLDVTSNGNRALITFDPASDQVTNTVSLGLRDYEGGLGVLASDNLLIAALANELVLLDPDTGAIVHRSAHPISNPVTGIAAVGDDIYVSRGSTTTYVMDRDGNVKFGFAHSGENFVGLAGGGGDGAQHVTLDGTNDVRGLLFGDQSQLGRITGAVYRDANGNGTQDAAEGGLGGVTLYLDQNQNGQFDNGEISTISAADGTYEFSGLAPGPYAVRQVVPDRYLQTSEGSDPGTFYGAAYIIGTSRLNYTEIDGLTGDVQRIGDPLPVPLHGLVRTNSGEIYGLNGGPAPDTIYRLNPNDDTLTLVGQTGYEMTFGLAYDPVTDTLYGAGKHTASDTVNFLLKIDRTDGSVTEIGNGFVGLTATSDLAFDPASRRVVAFDNYDDQFVAFDLDGTATQLADLSGINTYSLTYTDGGLVYGGIGVTSDPNDVDPRNELFSIDLATGARSVFLVLSEAAPFESLDWHNDPSQYRFLVAAGQAVSNVDFGNQSLDQAPVANAGGPYVINEGDGVTLNAGASSDPDNDPLTYRWDLNNDGQFDDATGATVDLSWSQLLALGIGDDGVYTVAVQVSDGELTDSATSTITVQNVAPTITAVSTSAGDVGDAVPGQTVSLLAAYTDPGTLDTHTAVIDWGDGSTSEVNGSNGTVAAAHSYAQGGVYSVAVAISDDDGGSDSATTDVFVTGFRIDDGVLQIVGTGQDDNISLRSQRQHGAEIKANFLPGPGAGFDGNQVSSIEVFLGAGDDHLTVDDSFSQPLLAVGGAGNDHITAGGGRSLIIGGTGADHLAGGSNQDILIAGTTSYDDNPAALGTLLTEWSSSAPLTVRLTQLTNPANDFHLVAGDTVQDDGDADAIFGSGDVDWLFYDPSLDRAHGRQIRDDLFANDLSGLLG